MWYKSLFRKRYSFNNIYERDIKWKCWSIILVPPKDICLYTNTQDQSNQRVIAKQIGEEWKDGKCKTCLCENSYDGPKANCLIIECPSMDTHSDMQNYVLEEILLDDKCCPIFERIACKWKDKIYNVKDILTFYSHDFLIFFNIVRYL